MNPSGEGTEFGLDDRSTRLCDGQSRREWLRIGGLSVFGLGLGDLLRAGAVPNPAMASPLGQGLGVAVVVQNATGQVIDRSGNQEGPPAELRIHHVSLSLSARPRHENML